MDPDDVPSHLPELTQIEQMTISKVITIMPVYKIRGNQTGYSGHVTNFPQDVATFAGKLSRAPANVVTNIILVKRGTAQNFREPEVNSGSLQIFLEYLENKNPYYASVEIGEETLCNLKNNPGVFDSLTVQDDPQNEAVDPVVLNELVESGINLTPRLHQATHTQAVLSHAGAGADKA